MPRDNTIIYIKNYKGSPLLIELSLFKQTGTQEQVNQQRQIRNDTAQTRGNRIIEKLGNFGIKLTSINNAPIMLEALEMQNIYGNEQEISSQLMSHYFASLKGNFFRVAASSDLIGNPYNFVNTLGRGVKSAYYEPRNGFMQGPLQGGLGIIKGTAGIVSVTGASVAGSIGKVTNVINKGIVAVSLDRDYIHDKEINDIKNKPKSTLDGVGQGFMGLGTSIFSGVTGVITKPLEGAKQSGFGGFFGGVGKGLAGLVAKPVSGVVDLVSKTTQGMEAHVTGQPDCQQNQQRIRVPRPFYRELNIVRDYNSLHAQVYNMIRYKFQQSAFFGAFSCQVISITDQKTQSYSTKTDILILTLDCLYLIDEKVQNVLWQVNNCDIETIDYSSELNAPKLQIMYTDTKSKTKQLETREFCFYYKLQLLECQEQLDEIMLIRQMKGDQ